MAGPAQIQRAYCTTREAAQMLGVSLRTAQLWSESGLLEAWKTDGGHRRISRESVERLLRNPVVEDSSLESSVASARLRPLSILVVDDEATLCLVYEMTLSRWEMKPHVSTAYDGYEALIRIGLERPDLIVTDLRMPGLDGFRMLKTLQTQTELADTAVVVVTGLSPDEIAAGGGIPEGIPVLPKPIPFPQLHEIAQRVASARGADACGNDTIHPR